MKLFISKLIQIVLSIKETLPASNQLYITNVVNTFLDVIAKEDILDGIISAIDALKSVILSVADSYKQATGNAKQADLIFNLLTKCLVGMSHLRERAFEGKGILFHCLYNGVVIV